MLTTQYTAECGLFILVISWTTGSRRWLCSPVSQKTTMSQITSLREDQNSKFKAGFPPNAYCSPTIIRSIHDKPNNYSLEPSVLLWGFGRSNSNDKAIIGK